MVPFNCLVMWSDQRNTVCTRVCDQIEFYSLFSLQVVFFSAFF